MPELLNEIKPMDISYILDNPWKISKIEWGLGNKSARNNQLSNIIKRLELSENGGYSKVWKTPNNKPIAILGGYKVEDKKYETFFIASKYMDEYALKLSFDMRKILKDKSYQYKGCTCGLYSMSDHPKQLTWFRFLGFKYIPEGNIGNSRYFEYRSPAK